MVWKRARSAEQKAVRFKEILEAAYSLFEKESYEQISLNGIARCAGISKPNIYRYFCSREEIFLKIFEEEFWGWLDELIEAAGEFSSKSSCREIAEKIADITANRKKLLRLAPYLLLSLEKSASFKEVYEFKKKGLEAKKKLGEVLYANIPHIFSPSSADRFNVVFSVISGLSPMEFRSGALKKVMEMPEFNCYSVSFRNSFADTMEVILLGMERLTSLNKEKQNA